MTNPVVTIEMANGKTMTAELYPEIAPNTVRNFVELAQKGFYNGTIFHRIIPGFMIQGGDPQGTGIGGPGYCIKGEFTANGFQNDLVHTRGVLSMARTMAPDTAGSQFFIMVEDAPHLDGQYAAFGKIISGMETADEIVRAGLMVKAAGMKLSVTCIAGLGSLELSEEHAVKTAEALSRMKPEYIGLLTLLFELETPLMRDWQEGRFYLMNPIEIAAETLILLEHIDCEGSIFRANHASNYVNLAGALNRDREAMCARLRQALEGKIKFRSEAFRAR